MNLKFAIITVLTISLMAGTLNGAGQEKSVPGLQGALKSQHREFPNSPEGRFFKKIVLLREELIDRPKASDYGRSLNRLASMAKGFINRYPGSKFVAEAKISRAMAFLSLSRIAKAIQLNYLESAHSLVAPLHKQKNLDMHTRVMVLFIWSEIMFTKKKPHDAINALEEIYEKYPKHPRTPQALTAIAQIRVSRFEHDLALDAYRRLITNYPDSELVPEAYRQIITLYCMKNDMKGAEKAMDEMLATFKDNPITLQTLGSLAHKYEEQKNKKRAIEYYQKIEKIYENPNIALAVKSRTRFIKLKGNRIDDVELNLTDGKTIKIPDLRGKVVVLYFWGYWTKDTLNKLARVNWTYNQLHAKGLETIGVYFGLKEQDLKAALMSAHIKWPHVIEKHGLLGPLAFKLGLEKIPMAIVLDHEGVVREIDLLGAELHRAVEKLVGEIPPELRKAATRPASKPASRPASKPVADASAK